MNYFIKSGGISGDLRITDQTLSIGKKEYPISEVTYIQITGNPTFIMNGIVSIKAGGKDDIFYFKKKNFDEVREAVEAVNETIEEKTERMRASLKTAGDVYQFCIDHCLGTGVSSKWGEKHFQLIINTLTSGEEILLPFIGIHNYVSTTNHDENYAYAFTNKRIIMAQQKMMGQNLQTVSLDNINDVTINEGMLFSVITIDTIRERFNVGVGRDTGRSIIKEIHKVLDKYREMSRSTMNAGFVGQTVAAGVAGQAAATGFAGQTGATGFAGQAAANGYTPQGAAAAGSVPQANAEKSPVELIKEFKELLDMGIITQEEFDMKKKELLGL